MRKIATVLRVASFEEEAYILMATKKGVVKKTDLSEFQQPAPQRDLGPRHR